MIGDHKFPYFVYTRGLNFILYHNLLEKYLISGIFQCNHNFCKPRRTEPLSKPKYRRKSIHTMIEDYKSPNLRCFWLPNLILCHFFEKYLIVGTFCVHIIHAYQEPLTNLDLYLLNVHHKQRLS